MSERVKLHIADTTSTLEPDKIKWKPEDLSGFALGEKGGFLEGEDIGAGFSSAS